MKTQLIIISFVFYSISIFSQETYPPCVAFDTAGKEVLKTLTSHSNTLYSGIDNIFEINSKQLKQDSFFLKAENGHLFKESKYKYLIIPTKIGVSKIKIYSKKDSSLIFSTELKVVRLPKPYIVLDHKKLTDTVRISKELLLKVNRFDVELSPDLIFDEKMYEINDFSLGYKFGRLYMRKNASGSTLTNEMLQIINNFNSGQEFDIQFYIRSEGDIIQTLPPIKAFIL